MRKYICTASIFITLMGLIAWAATIRVPDFYGFNRLEPLPFPAMQGLPIAGTAPLLSVIFISAIFFILIGAFLTGLWLLSAALCKLLRGEFTEEKA